MSRPVGLVMRCVSIKEDGDFIRAIFKEKREGLPANSTELAELIINNADLRFVQVGQEYLIQMERL